MAVYKVIQDIESEDRLLGPLTLKGLVYAMAALALGFINYKILLVTGLGPIRFLLVLLLALPMLLFAVLASPLGREQPTEVWLLSRIRFLMKPKVRIWNQSGLVELVTITVPKRIEQQLTKGFSQAEVASRLQALATTLDSRGWAVKNVNVNLGAYGGYYQNQDSDRLIDTSNILREVPVTDIHASDDMLDAQSNPTAQKFQDMMLQAENQRRQELQARLDAARNTDLLHPAAEEEPEMTYHEHKELIHDLKSSKGPLPKQGVEKSTSTEVTPVNQAAKLELAQSGNDLSVATIAQLVNRGGNGEVSIALR